MSRRQFPIVAGFALTVNKAQGLTIKEGVVINLAGSQRFRPAGKHGLPFVAWTRSESFAMTAFKNLPALSDFVKGRSSAMLRMRRDFTAGLQRLHERTMAEHSHMKTPADEDREYAAWYDAQQEARRLKKRKEGPPRMTCPAWEAAGF